MNEPKKKRKRSRRRPKSSRRDQAVPEEPLEHPERAKEDINPLHRREYREWEPRPHGEQGFDGTHPEHKIGASFAGF